MADQPSRSCPAGPADPAIARQALEILWELDDTVADIRRMLDDSFVHGQFHYPVDLAALGGPAPYGASAGQRRGYQQHDLNHYVVGFRLTKLLATNARSG
jgi:hypothetical protein